MTTSPVAAALHESALSSDIYQAPDFLLQELVQIVNRTPGSQIGVTLLMGGVLVSGKLIGGAEFLEQYGVLLAAGFGMTGEAAENTKASFKERGNSLYLAEENSDESLPGKIHLKDAQFFNQRGEPIVSQGTLWRGRIASVDGYFLGSLSASKS